MLENWGLLWIWHSVVVLLLCLLTNFLQERGVQSPGPYLLIWTVGFTTWAAIFWWLRHRGGPVTFVERQIAHVWGASMIGCSLLFVIEILLGLPVFTLSPVLAVFGGMVFLIKAGILSGMFYIPAAGDVFDRGLDGDVAAVRDHDVRNCVRGGVFRAGIDVSPPARAGGPNETIAQKKFRRHRLIRAVDRGSSPVLTECCSLAKERIDVACTVTIRRCAGRPGPREPEAFTRPWHGGEVPYSWWVFVALALTAILGTSTYGLTMGLLGGPGDIFWTRFAARWPPGSRGGSPCLRSTSSIAFRARGSGRAPRCWPRSSRRAGAAWR